MAQPIWETPAGSLGTIPQGVYFAGPVDGNLMAQNAVSYRGIAGTFPKGIQLLPNGSLTGVPLNNVLPQDTVYQFTVRAYSVDNQIADRTFSLTITGAYTPTWITPAGSIGSAYDSDFFDFQFQYIDENPNAVITLFSGQLPGGLTLTPTGRLYGYVAPPQSVNPGIPEGYELTPEDIYPYDFLADKVNVNYQFSLEINDGVNSNVRTFTIFVYNRATLTADTTEITADNSFVTADQTPEMAPFIINSVPTDLGVFRSDNYFAYQFIGEDYSGAQIKYAKALAYGESAAPIPNFDSGSGWYYGYVPDQGSTEVLYNWSVIVYQADYIGTAITVTDTTVGTDIITCNSTSQLGANQPLVFTGTAFGGIIADPGTVYFVKEVISPTEFTISTLPDSAYTVSLTSASGTMQANLIVASRPYDYSLTITTPVFSEVTWITPEDLGVIDNGSISLLKIEATDSLGRTLLYQLKSGAYNNLPQGLELLPSGDIAGRVSFDTFSLDLGETTFDQDLNINRNLRSLGTTFDATHVFTVNAYVESEPVSVFKTFSVQVLRRYNRPYQNLYIKAMPPESSRQLIDNLLSNTDIFVPDYIFRPTDPNFGKATDVIYWHAYGLEPATLATYVNALDLNHYWKNLVLGQIQTAQALDAQGNVIYEVVYSKIIDNLVNNQGESVSKIVPLPYPVNAPGPQTGYQLTPYQIFPYDFYNIVTAVYPNSLVNMRDQMADVVGQESSVLPRWMLSEQPDGSVLGFTPAWVICYTKPGRSKQIAYYLNKEFTDSINKFDFEVDRYELDALLSKNWCPDETYLSGHNVIPPGDLLVGPGIWCPAANQTTFDKFGDTGYNLLGPVTYGTALAYTDVNGKRRSDINDLGGIDGIVPLTTGDTLIFVKQENYNNYATTDEAWQDYIAPFDSGVVTGDLGSFDVADFDESYTVPGGGSVVCLQTLASNDTIVCDSTSNLIADQEIKFTGGVFGGIVQNQTYYILQVVSSTSFKIKANINDITPVALTNGTGFMTGAPANQRMAIYTITVDPVSDIVSLELTTQTQPLDEVVIVAGNFYKNSDLFYPTSPTTGFTRVAWRPVSTVLTTETTFDENSLLFIEPVDMYNPTDEYDKYLVFPKVNILE